jgi:hypothetical protein
VVINAPKRAPSGGVLIPLLGMHAEPSESAFAPAAPRPSKARQAARLQNPRELVARFALTVTERTPVGISWIAKNGDDSLFRIFQRMVPQVQ